MAERCLTRKGSRYCETRQASAAQRLPLQCCLLGHAWAGSSWPGAVKSGVWVFTPKSLRAARAASSLWEVACCLGVCIASALLAHQVK